MISLPKLLAISFPKKSQEEIDGLAASYDSKEDLQAYNKYNWSAVKKADLVNEDVKIKLVGTLYNSQLNYVGVEEEILRNIEGWSNGKIAFKDMDDDSVYFYQVFYCHLAWLNFEKISYRRKLFLLQSRFLVMACAWDVPIFDRLQAHFSKFAYVKFLRQDSRIFSQAIKTNPTLIGDKGKTIKAISRWLEELEAFEGSDFSNKVDEFIEANMDVQRLSESNRKILHKIAALYWSLRTEVIWKELGEFTTEAGYEPKEPDEEKETDVEEAYLEILRERFKESREMELWLEEYKDIAYWLDVNEKDEGYILELFRILREKVDLKSKKQVDLLLKLIAELQKRGLSEIEDIVYFNEKDQQFHWDEEFFS